MLCSVPCRKALPHPHSTEKTGTREAQRGLPGSTPPQHYLWQVSQSAHLPALTLDEVFLMPLKL